MSPPLVREATLRKDLRELLKRNDVSSKVPLRRKTRFAAQAGSPEVNGGISIIVGIKKCRQRNLVSQSHEIFRARPERKICENIYG